MAETFGSNAVPLPATLIQMMTGYWVSQALYVAAKLGVADLLSDERSVTILQQCRRAIPAHGKLLVIELVLPSGQEPFFGKWLDLHMLVLLGARERTAAEFEALFHASGFALSRVIPTAAGPSIVEAVPV